MLEIILKGGIVMIPLIVCSILSVAIIIERLIFWSKQKKGAMPEDILKMAQDGKFDELVKGSSDSNSSISKIILSGVKNKNTSASLAMESAAIEEIAKTKKYLPALDTIITLAPLLGLLGTIVGMIQSFDIMSVAGIGQPHAVTGGVAEALIATAAGITVAITTLVPYNYFLSKVERATEEMERYAARMEMILKQ
ncbi:MAG: hypothetical protein A2022_05490 [Deltaproteobacteria bacterium GWF2_42_12]|nr:MAG: hypothetical protein A2090_06410 [Deltaproteobacteria bacterium GWD2_42_10]OGP48745.1 MAG: hypothetical protein A2022_05490 [Deltaproteobacteria bacterium GWF2_42_12]OGQ24209.1 MAG: hypothetical protein A3D29_08855 [Deltaproteobacteria bacterium RIFCSPHIGHO2_02_FULL_42_44]OGQ64495.1 MAG: hypothetical protein A3F88_01965 [Deltaproteobacteria bacterium RIFCSPLOWO2_12_FULL_42_16]